MRATSHKQNKNGGFHILRFLFLIRVRRAGRGSKSGTRWRASLSNKRKHSATRIYKQKQKVQKSQAGPIRFTKP